MLLEHKFTVYIAALNNIKSDMPRYQHDALFASYDGGPIQWCGNVLPNPRLQIADCKVTMAMMISGNSGANCDMLTEQMQSYLEGHFQSEG